MELMINIDLKKLPQLISYTQRIMLTGSCFTEHIGNSLADLKFSVLQNPNGILFDPISVCQSLVSYIDNKQYGEDDLFNYNELWQSWHHHSRFSGPDKQDVLNKINKSQAIAHDFLKSTDWLIITLGSSFSYRLVEAGILTRGPSGSSNAGKFLSVANCHRAPSQWFRKHLLEIDEILAALDNCIHRLLQFNENLKVIFTVSPVRHIRDGVVENNRSKSRLLEAVHHIVNRFDNLYYFPAYELVIDVLRDYRFYDIDLVHPNYAATEFVLEKFTESCIDESAKPLMKEIKGLAIARKHKAFQPSTNAHKQFLESYHQKVIELQNKYAFLDLQDELDYFSTAKT